MKSPRPVLRAFGLIAGLLMSGLLAAADAHGAITVEVQVSSDASDAEQAFSGGMSLNNDKMELGQMAWVGFRFVNVNVPQGATITRAYVRMRAADSNSEATQLTIFAQNANNSNQFTNGNNNISNRPRTTASAGWSPVPAWTMGTNYQTPEIKAVVQEVVNRPGWNNGNSMAILIRSDNVNGKRLVVAHDDVPANAAVLHIEYVIPPLVGRWRFNETSGTTAVDATGHGNHGTLINGPIWTARCNGENALHLDGIDDYVTVPAATELNVVGDASLSGWFRLTSAFSNTTPGSMLIAEKFNNNDQNMHIALVGTNYTDLGPARGSLVFSINGGTGAFRYAWTNRTDWIAGRWYHFAIVIDADTPANNKVLIDGQDDTAGTSGTTAYNDLAYTANINIGGWQSENIPGQSYFAGEVADFRLYNRQLLPGELADLYGVAGHWPLDESSGTTAVDAAGQANDGTLTGTAQWTAGAIAGAHGFDYTNGDDYFQLPNSASLTDVQEESYTLAAWFRPLSTPPGTGTANTARYAVIIKEGHHLGLSYNNAQRFEMDHWLTGNVLVTAGGLSTAYPPGQFYHVAGVVNRSAGSVAIYVNGQLAGTTSYTPNTAARNYGGNRWRFGIANPGAGNNRWHAHGVIDDARIYNRALCDDEILALYEQGSGGFQGVKIIRWVEVQ